MSIYADIEKLRKFNESRDPIPARRQTIANGIYQYMSKVRELNRSLDNYIPLSDNDNEPERAKPIALDEIVNTMIQGIFLDKV